MRIANKSEVINGEGKWNVHGHHAQALLLKSPSFHLLVANQVAWQRGTLINCQYVLARVVSQLQIKV